ncbi:DUF4920 domain-containing protein [Aliifodinibius sp. S!AR15-10]|uniref:DUF4920 domain-containing protein n=1 Tax=Aliifodinibius sp. S!AR15-10 TaxID=2950437 RepID=UPI00285596C1|nr:DUF4920 domain-containing protein [Aliifodinibius sp. S!AR15-10]MDR8390725.1 DUF4920 domain-containing protein [Aliifodinibius sp. S!AR15-10]
MKTSNKTFLTYIFACSVLLFGIMFQPANAQDGWEEYGESITAEDAMDATAAIDHFSDEGNRIKVQGTVTAVCDKVGCWAQFETEDDQKIRVKFKDYSFFIPTESAGRMMIVEGTAFKEATEEGSEVEYRLEAVGVLLGD